MSKLAALDLFIRQALLYPLIAPFLPAVGDVRKDTAYAASQLVGTLEVGTILATGTICIWKSTVATIPAGFVWCDGNNGTPDMRDIFPVGAKQDDGGVAKSNIEGSLKSAGGNTQHNHGGNTGTYNWDVRREGAQWDSGSTDTHAHTIGNDNHIPTYKAFVFMMKT